MFIVIVVLMSRRGDDNREKYSFQPRLISGVLAAAPLPTDTQSNISSQAQQIFSNFYL